VLVRNDERGGGMIIQTIAGLALIIGVSVLIAGFIHVARQLSNPRKCIHDMDGVCMLTPARTIPCEAVNCPNYREKRVQGGAYRGGFGVARDGREA
jgi:hypothetical protein